MMSPRWNSIVLAAALFGALVACSGCAQVATVRCWHPAAIDVSGMQRIAVVDFRGEQGDAVAAALNSRLWDNRFYSLVDQSELTTVQHAAYVPDPGDQALLAQARDRGIDGIVFGEVHEYRCTDATKPASPRFRAGQSPDEADVEQPADEIEGVQASLSRSASVAVTFRLIDTRTGEVRSEKQTVHQFHGESHGDAEPLPASSEVLAKLTDLCLDDFLQELAPHQAEHAMQLAHCRWYCRDRSAVRSGNRLATQGDWDAARDQWQAAVDRHADSDAALFNLAIDAAHRQQYRQAEELAMQAIRIRHTDQYADGLARIREYRSSYDDVSRQRDRRVLQAAR